MNEIIQKCVDELSKDNRRIDYVLGMLETVLAMNPGSSKGRTAAFGPADGGSIPPLGTNNEEGAVLDATVAARLASVKAMSNG